MHETPVPSAENDNSNLCSPVITDSDGAATSLKNDADAMMRRIVFFDGICGLCDQTVKWLIRHDHKRRLRFAPLQGETARQYLSEMDIRELKSLVFFDSNETSRRSTAVVRILFELGWGWRVLGWLLWIIPRPIRDLGYRIISRHRYRIFGAHESCRLPRPEERDLFLP